MKRVALYSFLGLILTGVVWLGAVVVGSLITSSANIQHRVANRTAQTTRFDPSTAVPVGETATNLVARGDLNKITLFDLEDRNLGVFGRVRNDLSRPVERIGLQVSFYNLAGQLVAVRTCWMSGADFQSLPPLLPNSPVYFYGAVEDMPRGFTYRLDEIEAHYVGGQER